MAYAWKNRNFEVRQRPYAMHRQEYHCKSYLWQASKDVEHSVDTIVWLSAKLPIDRQGDVDADIYNCFLL